MKPLAPIATATIKYSPAVSLINIYPHTEGPIPSVPITQSLMFGFLQKNKNKKKITGCEQEDKGTKQGSEQVSDMTQIMELSDRDSKIAMINV